MNGELANVIALALQGTAWLQNPSAAPPDLEGVNSTFQYVGSVRFEPPPSRWRRTEALSSTGTWLRWLRAQRVRRLWLVIPEATGGPLEPHVEVAFSNGGQWATLATGRRASIWLPRWEVGDRNAADNRAWSVTYVGAWADGSTVPSRVPIDSALTSLADALAEARELAQEQALDMWADWFADGLERGRAARAEVPFHPDLAPRPPVTEEVARLLAAAAKSFVFGGMGSWNDVWLSDADARSRYDAVSRDLYRAVLGAFVAATNCELDGETAGDRERSDCVKSKPEEVVEG